MISLLPYLAIKSCSFGKEAAISLGFENRIAHGALLVAEISKVAAMDYPSRNAIYLGQNLDFKAPIYPNVELTGKAKLKHK